MKKLSGFTVIELMITISVIGVLAAVGVPSYQDFIKAGRITTAHNELVSAMQVARSGGIQAASAGCVCSSSSAGDANPTCSDSNNWESGWISFVDTNTTAVDVCVYDVSDGDVLLKAWNGNASSNLTIRNDNSVINAENFIRFNSRGVPVTAQGVIMQGMFKICDDRGLTEGGGTVVGRGVILSASGSVRSSKDDSVIVACL